MSEHVTQTELARRLGVSETAVRKHIQRGLYRARRDGKFDVDECRQAWENTRDPDAVLRGMAGAEVRSKQPVQQTGIIENSLTRARTAQAAMKAQREHLALKKATGEVISTADAYHACRAVISVVIERLEGVPSQVAPRVVGMTNAAEIERIFRDALNVARTEIAGMGGSIEAVVNGRK